MNVNNGILLMRSFKGNLFVEIPDGWKINNLALKDEVCCFGKESVSGYIPLINALKGGVCTLRIQSRTTN
jgi:hypothetical protein